MNNPGTEGYSSSSPIGSASLSPSLLESASLGLVSVILPHDIPARKVCIYARWALVWGRARPLLACSKT